MVTTSGNPEARKMGRPPKKEYSPEDISWMNRIIRLRQLKREGLQSPSMHTELMKVPSGSYYKERIKAHQRFSKKQRTLIYNYEPDVIDKRKEYDKEYVHRPEVIEHRKENKPSKELVKYYNKKYRQSQVNKSKIKEYQHQYYLKHKQQKGD